MRIRTFKRTTAIIIPEELWEETMSALEQAIDRLRMHAGNIGKEPSQVESRRVADLCQRVLDKCKQEDNHEEAKSETGEAGHTA